jgi:hypothetical protein
MGKLVNRAKMSVASAPGTGAISLGSAVSGYLSFAQAGVNDQDTVSYVIEDGSNWELGNGVYTASGTSLARSTILGSSNSGAAINATSGALVFVSALAGDLTDASVRQTVSSGPDSSGLPNFLPATSASLSLTTQNLSSATPLIVTAAQGFRSGGNFDYFQNFNANVTWSGLAASTTVYLYVNAATGALGSTTLQPIYQFGGTPAVTNGQFTFNVGEMIGYMGNGSSAPPTPLVFVGEAVTGASSVTSTAAYAYNGYYDSGWTTPLYGGGTSVSKNANIGCADNTANLVIQCISADDGYAVGDLMTFPFGVNGGPIVGSVWTSRNVCGTAAAASSEFNGFTPKGGGSAAGLSQAKWQYKLTAKRNW